MIFFKVIAKNDLIRQIALNTNGNFTAKLAMDVNMDLKESGLEEELVH